VLACVPFGEFRRAAAAAAAWSGKRQAAGGRRRQATAEVIAIGARGHHIALSGPSRCDDAGFVVVAVVARKRK